MKKNATLKISISGARGIVGESLTPQLAATLAQAFGTYVGGGPVLVGRDARPSGIMLSEAVTAGLLSVGCRPVDVGILPIPSFLFLTKATKSAGGIAVTASHNPKQWNGLKFISRNGLYLNPLQTEEYLDIYHQAAFDFTPPAKYKNVQVRADAGEAHLRRLLDRFGSAAVKRRGFKVAIDCNNGAGAPLAPRFLRELGCEVVPLYCEPNGEFAHDPEPTPENIPDVCAAVKSTGADIGFVQDADADRLAVVDEKGRPIGEELTLVLAARHVLSRRKGSIVCNLSSTRALDDIARACGVKLFRTKIGEINVVEKLLSAKPKAVIGGEGNGGVIDPEIHPCRDSFAAMGLILEALAAGRRPVSTLVSSLPRYVLIKDRIEGSAERAHRLIALLKKRYEKAGSVSLLDGLKVDFPDHWIHIRPSNTEPIIRILAEAKTAAGARKALATLKSEIAVNLKKL
ncbi:MAG: phosphoglucosamine mutase [Candidatus Aminicenantes bacterium]|nr:phosphoglucosamine mutase [Candidatus Aminicenantes bacterium]